MDRSKFLKILIGIAVVILVVIVVLLLKGKPKTGTIPAPARIPSIPQVFLIDSQVQPTYDTEEHVTNVSFSSSQSIDSLRSLFINKLRSSGYIVEDIGLVNEQYYLQGKRTASQEQETLNIILFPNPRKPSTNLIVITAFYE